MIKKSNRAWISIGVSAAMFVALNTFPLPPAAAQVSLSQCDQIEDRTRRQRCRSAVYDAQRYDEEARDWREEEARIRRDHERACRQVGLIARFTGSGRYLKAACVAPRVINDAIQRRRRN